MPFLTFHLDDYMVLTCFCENIVFVKTGQKWLRYSNTNLSSHRKP